MRLNVCFNEMALFGPFVPLLIKDCSSYGTILNSLYRVPFSYFFFWHGLCVIVPFFLSFLSCFCFVLFYFHALVGAFYYCKSSSDIFPVQQTTFFVSGLNAWTVDMTSHVGTIPTRLASYFLV